MPLFRVSVPDPTGLGLFTGNVIYYDSNGRVQQIADANNNVQVYTYGMNTQVQTVNTGTVADMGTQLFDGLNRDLGGIDALNHQANIFYEDPSNPYQPTRMVNRNQQTTLFSYDPTYGNLLTADVPSNGGRLTASYTYDYTDFAMGRLSSVQVGGKTPTSVTYYTNNTVVNNIPQANGLVRQVTSPAPNGAGTVATTYVYTALGNALQITVPGPNGPVTYAYNYTQDGNYTCAEALGEPLTITDPLGHVTHFRYDPWGNLTAMLDAIGRETDYYYNESSQLIETLYPPKGANSPGRSYAIYNYLYLGGPLQQTQFYDESGTLARSVLRTAGKEDETKAQTGSAEKATLTYDPSYRVKTLADGNGHAFGHQYDLNGNLKQFTHPLANMTTGYDTSRAFYDNDDNVMQSIDGKNQTFNFTLAPDDSRLTDILYPANTLGTTHYDYDQYGRVTRRTDKAGAYTYAYDDLDNLLSTTTTYKNASSSALNLPAQTISYVYNPDGSRKSMTTPGGTFSYTYDNDGRLTSVSFPWGQSVQYGYDDANRLTRQTQSKFTTTYMFDGLDNLLALNQISNDATHTTLANFTDMPYDATGNRLGMTMTIQKAAGDFTDASGVCSWTYDTDGKQDQLTGDGRSRNRMPGFNSYSETYQSDAADNLVVMRGGGQTYNADNQLLSGGGSIYDGNGNALGYTYDANNRIVGFGGRASAGYRDDGLRAWKQATYSGYPSITYYLYDGAHVVCELGSNGAARHNVRVGRNRTGAARVRQLLHHVYVRSDGQRGQPLSRRLHAQRAAGFQRLRCVRVPPRLLLSELSDRHCAAGCSRLWRAVGQLHGYGNRADPDDVSVLRSRPLPLPYS